MSSDDESKFREWFSARFGVDALNASTIEEFLRRKKRFEQLESELDKARREYYESSHAGEIYRAALYAWLAARR